MKNIVILISGRGSNLEALIAARDAGNLPVNIAAVISNRPEAMGLETAQKAGIAAHFINHKAFAGREAFDAALAEGILIAPGILFSNSNRFAHFVRRNCGWPYSPAIDHAVKRLGQLCAGLMGPAHDQHNR